MDAIYTSIYASGIGICLLAALQVYSTCKQSKLRYLAIFLLLEAFGFASEWLIRQPGEAYTALYFSALIMSTFFIAPCLWLLLCEITEKRTIPFVSTLNRQEWLIIIIGCAFCLPLLSVELSWHWLTTTGSSYKVYYDYVVHGGMIVSVAVFVVQVPYYLKRCQQLVRQNYQNSSLPVATIDAMNHLLKLLTIILGAKWVAAISRTLHCMSPNESIALANTIAIIEVIVVLTALFVFVSQSERLQSIATAFIKPLTISTKPITPLYEKSALTEAESQRIKTKLENAIENDDIFLDSRLTMNRLSEYLAEPSHYVTQVLSQKLNTNFYDLVNQCRITHAKKLLLEHGNSSILDIAYSVGFNSKSTFNTAFKRITSLTPSQFRNRIGNSNSTTTLE